MKCKNCNENDAIKYSVFTSGEFCSRECSRAFSTKSKRGDINKKVSSTLKQKYLLKELVYVSPEWTPVVRDKHSKSLREYHKRRINDIKTSLPFEKWPKNVIKRHVFEINGNKCAQCGYEYTDTKTGKGPFEIHHKDGNHDNWKENNLIVLCLNCHWKTPNWRFRGKKHNETTINKLKNCWKNGIYDSKKNDLRGEQ